MNVGVGLQPVEEEMKRSPQPQLGQREECGLKLSHLNETRAQQ